MTARPEISCLEYDDELDFIFLGCDGIFDVLTNEEVGQIVWETVRHAKESKKIIKGKLGINEVLGDCVDNVLKMSLIQKSEDNITAIIIAFCDLFEKV